MEMGPGELAAETGRRRRGVPDHTEGAAIRGQQGFYRFGCVISRGSPFKS